MKNTWIIVADEAIARILQWKDRQPGGELQNVEELTDPNAHAKGVDFAHDAQGRRSGAAPQGSANDNAPHRLRGTSSVTSSAGEGAQHLEAADFARHVARHLAEALQQKRSDDLQVIAAPRMLGLLRKAWSTQVQATVSLEWDKDLVHFENREIAARFAENQVGVD